MIATIRKEKKLRKEEKSLKAAKSDGNGVSKVRKERIIITKQQ